jgi:hypothetical protein
MVPVPEEHVQDVMQFVLREMARASLEPWDQESVFDLFDDVDEAGRSLLAYTARASMTGYAPDRGTSGRDAAAPAARGRWHRPRGQRASCAGQPPDLLVTRTVTETLPNGRTTEAWVVALSDDVAPLVRDAERAELAAVTPPLGDSSG